jgi:large subunit ribosomal protein L1
MGKTKTVVIKGKSEELSGEEKYKLKQIKKKEAEDKEKQAVSGVGLKGGERIKVIGGDLPPVKEEETVEEKLSSKKRKLRKRSKKYLDSKAKIDNKLYKIDDAVKLVKETSYAKFDASVELHLIVKKENISINLELPHFAGKTKKVEVADENTLKNLEKGKVYFDILLATPEMMPKLVPFAKILGPKGLMPNPKTGTLIKTEKDAAKFSQSKITIKTEKKNPVIHTVVGKVSQNEADLVENSQTVIDSVTTKQIIKAYLTSTMGPSIKLKV